MTETRLQMYAELAPWWPLLSAPDGYEEEATYWSSALTEHCPAPCSSLLELGSGGGNNASWMKKRFGRVTLVDLSPDMLEVSRALNPDCEHVAGDMRTVRLGRTFDAVLVHDAVTYMLSEADLRAAIETAFVHTRPGGAALFTPDDVADTFEDRAELIETSDGPRALKYIEWQWDPTPGDDRCRVEFLLLLREHGQVRAVHDRHEHALFPRATWIRLLAEAGDGVASVGRPIGDGESDEVFLCRRPPGRA